MRISDWSSDVCSSDLILGFTSVGPHRADWRMRFGKLTAREGLSRGQTKLAALACVLAQAQQFSVVRGYWPLVCPVDLASELDQHHLRREIAQLLARRAQVAITATEDVQIGGAEGREREVQY